MNERDEKIRAIMKAAYSKSSIDADEVTRKSIAIGVLTSQVLSAREERDESRIRLQNTLEQLDKAAARIMELETEVEGLREEMRW